MGWDNRVLNINGRGQKMLEAAIGLACDEGQSKSEFTGKLTDGFFHRIVASIVTPQGLVWLWAEGKGSTNYPAPLTVKQAAEISLAWLESEAAQKMKCDGWDANGDHDGDNTRGWRVFVEDWGHVGNERYSICAVRPVFLWHGK